MTLPRASGLGPLPGYLEDPGGPRKGGLDMDVGENTQGLLSPRSSYYSTTIARGKRLLVYLCHTK
jgi:hypothetical protein